MTWNDVWAALQNGLISILMAAISVGVAIAIAYINKLKDKATAQAQEIKDDATRKQAVNAINRITELAKSVVTSIEQETASTIRKQISSGELDADAGYKTLCALKDEAVQKILNTVNEETKEAAMAQIQDLQGYVEDLVSEYVYKIKNGLLDSGTVELISE